MHEAFENGAALHGVRDFRVELDGVELAALVGHAGDRAGRRRGHGLETDGQFHHGVAVAHPDLQHAVAFGRREVGDILQQRRMAVGTDFRVTELTRLAGGLGGHHLATQLLRHGLHAVADAEHRNPQIEHHFRRARRIALGHRTRAAGQDDALRAIAADEVFRYVVRVDFAEHLGFAHATGDQLGHLRTEIEDEDFLVSHFQNLE